MSTTTPETPAGPLALRREHLTLTRVWREETSEQTRRQLEADLAILDAEILRMENTR